MKKLFLALLFLLSIAGMAHAQNSTVVTVNTTDTQGTAWFGGTYSVNFVGPQQVSWPGGSFSRNYSGSLNSIGSFALSLPSNTTITPTPNFWTITTCPFPMLTSASDFCVTQQFTITGATQTINLTPAAPQILGTSPAPVAAYSDAEIAPIVSLGFIYYQIQTATTGQNRVCQVATSAGACTLWGNIGPGQPPTGFPRLDQVLNPNVDKSFDLGSSFLAFTNGPLDFTNATSLALPVAGSCVASANGQICFDSTALNWHLWSGADQFLATFPVASPPTSGDVSGFLLNAGQWTMQDLGPVNTLTGQSFLNLNMTTPIDGDIPCFDSTGPPYWNNCTAGTVATVISGATSTYTFALTDNQTIIEHDSAGSASVTATLPTADTLGFPAMGFIYSNHSALTDSIVPTTWTINSVASLDVPPGVFCRVYVDTNSTTNWLADCANITASSTPPATFNNQLQSGGGVTWTGLLHFTVSAATYSIAGTQYMSPQTNLTLAAADVTNPRIDVIAVDNTGAAIVITGTPAGSPAAPSVDPTSQLALTFVTVAANATVPTLSSILVYDENSTPPTEYTCTPTSNFNCNSTNNPFHLTHDIEATTAVAGNGVTLVNSGTVSLSAYSTLSFNIRNKAAWPNGKSLSICFLNGATVVGNCLGFKNGVFGFNQNNLTSYQQIVVPLSQFALGAVIDRVRFQVVGGGASIGFYLDWIQIQSTLSGSGTTGFQLQVNGQNTQQTTNFADNASVTWACTVAAGTTVSVCKATAVGAPPSGSAGGDLTGTYPNPTLLHPSTTVNGQTCTLGSTCTVTVASGTITIANGSKALGTSLIASGACATVVTDTATGTATTDNIMADFNADPTSTTGYSASANGMLTIIKYPTANTVNFKVCNNTGASITPGAVTLNWRVVR